MQTEGLCLEGNRPPCRLHGFWRLSVEFVLGVLAEGCLSKDLAAECCELVSSGSTP